MGMLVEDNIEEVEARQEDNDYHKKVAAAEVVEDCVDGGGDDDFRGKQVSAEDLEEVTCGTLEVDHEIPAREIHDTLEEVDVDVDIPYVDDDVEEEGVHREEEDLREAEAAVVDAFFSPLPHLFHLHHHRHRLHRRLL